MRRFAACLLLLIAPVALRATVILPIEFRELVTTSQVIVHGRVTDIRSAYVDGRTSIQTFVTIAADDYLKGDLGEYVTFFVPGGQIGPYRTVFVGAPEFREGDALVLFLKSSGSPVPYIVGLSQGAYRVVVDQRGRHMVTTPVVMSRQEGATERVVRGDPARQPITIEAFRGVVRDVIAAQGAGR